MHSNYSTHMLPFPVCAKHHPKRRDKALGPGSFIGVQHVQQPFVRTIGAASLTAGVSARLAYKVCKVSTQATI